MIVTSIGIEFAFVPLLTTFTPAFNICIMLIARNLVFFVLILSLPVAAQKLKKADQIIISSLTSHVNYLADDKLEGRRVGTAGEKIAREYIKTQFEKIGLEPMGDNRTYFQGFDVYDGKFYNAHSYLIINGEQISHDDYFPLPSSPQISLESRPSMALKEAGVPWFLDIKEDLEAEKENPHFSLHQYLESKATGASKKGATALFIFNSNSRADQQKFDPKQKADSISIPVVYVSNKIAAKYFNDETAELALKLKVQFTENKRTGYNVIGFINNGAVATVIVGAHYDHLGYGEDGGSLMRTGEKLIHNGADDNASGTAALIELSRLLKKSKLKNNNYLFIAFSGEELGLFGSKHFTDHPTVDLSTANYMINMDMVGRLNDSKTVTIGGYGTSPLWAQIFHNAGSNPNIISRYDSSGTGPSDHTSFYRKNIPVLFFFTGVHSDYHKPSDDVDKLNITGEYRIVQYIYKLIESANKSGKLAFTKTRDQQSATAARFTVTLGIMPDYTFNGNGVKVDGVSEGRPAEKAGLKVGDVVVQLGDYPVTSIENYMNALNKFKKGDKTMVKIKRADSTVDAEVTF